jgi:hypothetical protein
LPPPPDPHSTRRRTDPEKRMASAEEARRQIRLEWSRLQRQRVGCFHLNGRTLITIGTIGSRFSEKTRLQTKKFAIIRFD